MDAGEREYAGAVAGFQETNGRRFSQSRGRIRDGRVVSTWAVGDYIRWREKQEGGEHQGYVIEVLSEERDGMYRVKGHRVGGGQECWDVSGDQVIEPA